MNIILSESLSTIYFLPFTVPFPFPSSCPCLYLRRSCHRRRHPSLRRRRPSLPRRRPCCRRPCCRRSYCHHPCYRRPCCPPPLPPLSPTLLPPPGWTDESGSVNASPNQPPGSLRQSRRSGEIGSDGASAAACKREGMPQRRARRSPPTLVKRENSSHVHVVEVPVVGRLEDGHHY